jgi:hypothetical protein
MTLKILTNDFSSFIEVPFEIYKGFNHVSLFKDDLKRFLNKNNPLFENENDFKYFTVLEDNRPVGRICAHIHRASNRTYKLSRGYFGYFECENNSAIAKLLLDAATDFLKKMGMNEIVGNFNMTAMQQCGVMDKIHIDYHYTDQVFSPEYISNLLKENGFSSFFPMGTYEVDVPSFKLETFDNPKQKSIFGDSSFKFEKLNKNNFKKLINDARLILNDGFRNNPMFVPLREEEMDFQAKDMLLIIDKDLSVVAYKDNIPVGVVVCIPDLNPFLQNTKSRLGLLTPFYFFKHKLKKDRAIIIYYSVSEQMHGQGLNGCMLRLVFEALKKNGYKKLGITWIAEENAASIRQVEKMHAIKLHDLSLYRKNI